MSEREDALKARVRETPLLERLAQCRQRVADMCSERRGPRMSIPVEYRDDDFYICTTVEDAKSRLAEFGTQMLEADAARKHAQEEGSKLIEKVRALEIRLKGETVQSVTEWANETFGPATIQRQVERAREEFSELEHIISVPCHPDKLAEEAADVCICLYRVIGTLDPEAINKKMAKNRARQWNVGPDGCGQHITEGL